MKKKFIGSLLLASLTLASTSTFVSCKDYDDDINGLSQRIDDLAKIVDGLKAQIEAGSVITDVTSNGNGVTVTLSNGKTYTISNGAAGVDGKSADVWKIGTDGYWYCNDKKTDYYALGTKGDKGDKGDQGEAGTPGTPGTPGAAGSNGTNGKYYVPNPATGTFWVYNDGDKDPYDSNIAYTATAENVITAVWDKENLTLTGVKDAEGGTIVISLSSKLKSLVFDPDFYYEGIEAFDLATFEYYPETVNENVDANGNYQTDKPTTSSDVFVYAPDLAASYFLNPSNAKIALDAKNYGFIAYNKDFTRSAGEDISKKFKVESVDKNDGQITVHAKYNGDVLKSIANDSKVSVLALQYTTGDSVITSDFAAIKSSKYTNLVLNNPKYGTQSHSIPSHLYRTAASAIAAAPTVPVVYDKTIDLREYVNTDLVNSKDAASGCTSYDVNAAEGKVEKVGFKYEFKLVGYTEGTNVTKQSAHAAIAADGYTLRPQMTKDGNQAKYGETEQTRATLGRMPLVRVVLRDTVNNKIATVGYMKLEIVDGDKVDQEITASYSTDKAYTLACNDNIELMKLSWFQVEERLINELGMSKTEFETKYALDGTLADADQFTSNSVSAVAVSAADKIGVVSQTTADVDGNETQVILWNINSRQAYNLFKQNGKKPLKTYVRYTLRSGETAAHKYVYVELTWTPSAINIEPETAFGTGNKIKGYWYSSNSNVAGTGYDAIAGNVEVVGTTDNIAKNGCVTDAADCEYTFDIRNTLRSNTLSVDPFIGAYANLTSGLALEFTFENGHGLYANAAGDKVYSDQVAAKEDATKKANYADYLVASMVKSTGIVTLAKTDEAKRLLNKVGHDDYENTLTAIVGVNAKLCGDIDVKLKYRTFDVRFLRPINVKAGELDTLTDAETSGSSAALKLTFTDWRDHDFLNATQTKGHDYFRYYGVKKITVDTANATTDLNGNPSDKLSDVTNKIKFEYVQPAGNGTQIVAGDYGSIRYQNNGVTVGKFTVKFKATVEYTWGKIENIEITANVNKTVNNAKRR